MSISCWRIVITLFNDWLFIKRLTQPHKLMDLISSQESGQFFWLGAKGK